MHANNGQIQCNAARNPTFWTLANGLHADTLRSMKIGIGVTAYEDTVREAPLAIDVVRHALSNLNDEVSRRALRHLYVHLPRFSLEELAKDGLVASEIKGAQRTAENGATAYYKRFNVDTSSILLDSLESDQMDEQDATRLLDGFHYLGGSRDALAHVGLFARDSNGMRIPVAIASLSRFDLRHLIQHLHIKQPAECLVLSRLAAIPQAPRNSISVLLSDCPIWP